MEDQRRSLGESFLFFRRRYTWLRIKDFKARAIPYRTYSTENVLTVLFLFSATAVGYLLNAYLFFYVIFFVLFTGSRYMTFSRDVSILVHAERLRDIPTPLANAKL